jgi:hypothetical protein
MMTSSGTVGALSFFLADITSLELTPRYNAEAKEKDLTIGDS